MDWVLFLDGGHLLTWSHKQMKLRLQKAPQRGKVREKDTSSGKELSIWMSEGILYRTHRDLNNSEQNWSTKNHTARVFQLENSDQDERSVPAELSAAWLVPLPCSHSPYSVAVTVTKGTQVPYARNPQQPSPLPSPWKYLARITFYLLMILPCSEDWTRAVGPLLLFWLACSAACLTSSSFYLPSRVHPQPPLHILPVQPHWPPCWDNHLKIWESMSLNLFLLPELQAEISVRARHAGEVLHSAGWRTDRLTASLCPDPALLLPCPISTRGQFPKPETTWSSQVAPSLHQPCPLSFVKRIPSLFTGSGPQLKNYSSPCM